MNNTTELTQIKNTNGHHHPIKSLVESPEIQAKFKTVLKERSGAYLASVVQIAMSSEQLRKADPVTIINAAMTAATLNLPINNSLGFAYILPYQAKQQDGSYKTVAQFQLGYKAFIQLAQRSGQFKTISAAAVYEGQIKSENPLEGFEFDWSNKLSDNVVGYAAYFKLINGFEKTLYMTVEQLKAHGLKYSKTASKNYGLWTTDFDAMAQKTVIKLLLSKYAPLSVDMQTAAISDQSVINNPETLDVTYIDNDEVKQVSQEEKESERLSNLINNAKSAEELKKLLKHVGDEHRELYNTKLKQFAK
jgi:recombination protein RecT